MSQYQYKTKTRKRKIESKPLATNKPSSISEILLAIAYVQRKKMPMEFIALADEAQTVENILADAQINYSVDGCCFALYPERDSDDLAWLDNIPELIDEFEC